MKHGVAIDNHLKVSKTVFFAKNSIKVSETIWNDKKFL